MIEEKLKTTAILKTPKGTHFQYTLYIRYTIYDIYIRWIDFGMIIV